MDSNQLQLLLADDDEDDCLFFKEAVDELQLSAHLTTVHDGEQLMQWLIRNTGPLPYALFLDLNMPRKSGFECLSEIKQNLTLTLLPVIILSTSFDPETADWLYKIGAQLCIRKPANFSQLKQVIQQALTLIASANGLQVSKENFVLNGNLR